MRKSVAFCLLAISLTGCSNVQNGSNEQISSSSSAIQSSVSATHWTSSLNSQSYPISNTYEARVIQIGGEGSHTITKSVWNTQENTTYPDDIAAKLVVVGFNTPGDVMWTNCYDGYTFSDCKSSTSQLMPDKSPGCGILLTDQLKNLVQIVCTRHSSSSGRN